MKRTFLRSTLSALSMAQATRVLNGVLFDGLPDASDEVLWVPLDSDEFKFHGVHTQAGEVVTVDGNKFLPVTFQVPNGVRIDEENGTMLYLVNKPGNFEVVLESPLVNQSEPDVSVGGKLWDIWSHENKFEWITEVRAVSPEVLASALGGSYRSKTGELLLPGFEQADTKWNRNGCLSDDEGFLVVAETRAVGPALYHQALGSLRPIRRDGLAYLLHSTFKSGDVRIEPWKDDLWKVSFIETLIFEEMVFKPALPRTDVWTTLTTALDVSDPLL